MSDFRDLAAAIFLLLLTVNLLIADFYLAAYAHAIR